MAIVSFEILSVPVRDQELAKAFYRDTLGFTLLREESMGPSGKWIQLAPPGSTTTIALGAALVTTAAYLAVATGTAGFLFRRRDVTA